MNNFPTPRRIPAFPSFDSDTRCSQSCTATSTKLYYMLHFKQIKNHIILLLYAYKSTRRPKRPASIPLPRLPALSKSSSARHLTASLSLSLSLSSPRVSKLASPSMATRRRPPSSSTSSAPPIADEVRSRDPKPSAAAEDPPLAPPKLGFVAAASALFFVPFFYLAFVHYPIEPDLRRSIAISVAMSFGGFLVALRMIPVAARYVLRRNLFGYDINKRGTPQGTVKV